MRSHICVTGGAGYVGSHTVWALADQGVPVVVYDDLSTGHQELLPRGVPVVIGDVRDQKALQRCLEDFSVKGVIHCAALALVGESMKHPGRYWSVNAGGTGALAEACLQAGVRGVVFSSTAAVYGEPEQIPIPERHPCRPINPYGRSKVAAEQALADAEAAGGPPWIAFRYFNAAGADPQGRAGEWHEHETHIIPNILKVALALSRGGAAAPVELFGNDYPTQDGTCVRDYVHVLDLAAAHLRGMDYLLAGGRSQAFNLGNGEGTSLRALIRAARQVTGQEIPYRVAPRRPGDPAQLVADPDLAWQLLGWRARHSQLEEILRTAWSWHQRP
jgi:UDP-glucose-4-epimerase GalE